MKARRSGSKDYEQIDIIEKNENLVSQQKDLEEKDEEIDRLSHEVKVNFSQIIVLLQTDQTQKCNFHLFTLEIWAFKD